jgi:hypothetical protein
VGQFPGTPFGIAPFRQPPGNTTNVSGEFVEATTRTLCGGVPTRMLNVLQLPSMPSLRSELMSASQAFPTEKLTYKYSLGGTTIGAGITSVLLRFSLKEPRRSSASALEVDTVVKTKSMISCGRHHIAATNTGVHLRNFKISVKIEERNLEKKASSVSLMQLQKFSAAKSQCRSQT